RSTLLKSRVTRLSFNPFSRISSGEGSWAERGRRGKRKKRATRKIESRSTGRYFSILFSCPGPERSISSFFDRPEIFSRRRDRFWEGLISGRHPVFRLKANRC